MVFDQKQNGEKIIVIIPAFNEAPRIASVVHGIRQILPQATVLVIDDGSQDDTSDVARGAGALAIRHVFNMGYGVALQTGYKYAYIEGFDVIAQMDGDGQHDSQWLPVLLEERNKRNVDMALGSRFLAAMRNDIPLLRRLGIEFFSKLSQILTGYRIYDVTSGFQVFHRRVLDYFISPLFPTDYPDADLLILLNRYGYSIAEIPVWMKPSPPGKKSMHEGFKIFYYIYKMSLSVILAAFGKLPILSKNLK